MDESQGLASVMGLLSIGGGLLWLIAAAVQLGCIIHVVRTGRPYWWILVIFWFPAFGAIAYLFFEVMPSLGKINVQALLWRLKSPQQRIVICAANLDESPTVTNRLAMADELHTAGKYDRECDVLRDGLQGPFKEDAMMLLRLAEAHLEAGRIGEAENVLTKVKPESSPDQQMRFALLTARIVSHKGTPEEAEKVFQDLIAKKKSEGPRYHYAEFLLRRGKRDQATPILRDIIAKYRRGTPVWRYVERRWFYASKALLKAPPPPTARK